MNRKSNLQSTGNEALENGEYAVRRNHRFDLVALFISLLVALLVWVVVMNLESTETLSLSLPQDGLCYELSGSDIQVRGRLADIKGHETVAVRLPADLKAGDTYALCEADLDLPDGVELVSALDLVVTVCAK